MKFPKMKKPPHLLFLLILILVTFWSLSMHLYEHLSPRQMGAFDEGAIVDNTYMLVKNLAYPVEFYTKGHLYYFGNALLLKVAQVFQHDPISFEQTALFLRLENIFLLGVSIYFIFLIIHRMLRESVQTLVYGGALLGAGFIYFLASATLVIRSNPDFLVSAFGVISFYFLIRFIQEKQIKYLISSAVILGIAIQIKWSVLILAISYGVVMLFQSVELNEKRRFLVSTIPLFMGLSLYPFLLITDSFNGVYFGNVDSVKNGFLVFQGVCLVGLGIHWGCYQKFQKYRRLLTNLSGAILYVGTTFFTMTGAIAVLSLHNPYRFHAFLRPLYVSILVSSKEGESLSVLGRLVNRMSILSSEMGIMIVGVLIAGVCFYVVHLFKRDTDGYRDPVGISLFCFVFFFFILFNKSTFRYMHPYLFLVVIGSVLGYFSVIKKWKLLVPIVVLGVVISSINHPIFSKVHYKSETYLKENETIDQTLSELRSDLNSLIFSPKLVIIPKRYPNWKLIGESNRSYFYSQENFPRPLWKNAPDIIILSKDEFELMAKKDSEMRLSSLFPFSKMPQNNQIHSDSKLVNEMLLDIDGDIMYTLRKSIKGDLFIYAKKN